jgi:hypothetical protein
MDPDLDPDADPTIFVIDLQDDNTTKDYKLLCSLLFKDKKSKRSDKSVGIKVFLTIFAW